MSVATESYPGPREIVDAVFAEVAPYLEETNLSLLTTGRDSENQTVTAVLETSNPGGERVRFVCEVRRATASRLRDLRPKLSWLTDFADRSHANPMFISMFISPSLRSELRERRISYADASGNLWLYSESPSLMIRNNGRDRNPEQTRGPVPGSLRGEGAAAVVRSLLDIPLPLSIPDLISRSGTSASVAYRVVEVLSAEGLIEKSGREPIESIEWEGTLRRWAEDYAKDRPSRANRFFDPRGAGNAVSNLANSNLSYVVSGSYAAAHYVPSVSPALATVFGDPEEISNVLRIPAENERPNVLVFEPGLTWAEANSIQIDGLRIAAPSQVAVDLMTGPGREPEEADILVNWIRGRRG